MPRRKRGAVPPYLLHHATGQAYSTWRGKSVYHGKHGTVDSQVRYARWVESLDLEPKVAAPVGSIKALADDYREQVASLLSKDEQRAFRANLDELCKAYGNLAPDKFGPLDLKRLREVWIRRDLARQTINKLVGRIRRVFRWGVSEGRVNPMTLAALEAVDDLKSGRTTAKDYEDVPPVPLRDLAATLKQLAPRYAAMVRFQYYVGCRPGEVCRLKASELHRGTVKVGKRTVRLQEGVWAFTPTTHKNLLKGKSLVYLVGPRAQKAIAAYLRSEGYLFSPKESWAEQFKRRRKRSPRLGDHYRTDTYYHAVAKACELAGVPVWGVGRLRHSFASRLDRIAGIAATSTAMGHASIATTEIYAERNIRQAADLAARHG
jgi:integrase